MMSKLFWFQSISRGPEGPDCSSPPVSLQERQLAHHHGPHRQHHVHPVLLARCQIQGDPGQGVDQAEPEAPLLQHQARAGSPEDRATHQGALQRWNWRGCQEGCLASSAGGRCISGTFPRNGELCSNGQD